MILRIKSIVSASLLVVFLIVLPLAAYPAELSPVARTEIDHLMTFMEKSGCRFYRNGTWYTDPKAVRDHVDTKYRYFLDKGKISSAEDFIKWSATKSELSGKPYLIKCGAGPEQPLGQWLTDELGRFRKGKGAGPG